MWLKNELTSGWISNIFNSFGWVRALRINLFDLRKSTEKIQSVEPQNCTLYNICGETRKHFHGNTDPELTSTLPERDQPPLLGCESIYTYKVIAQFILNFSDEIISDISYRFIFAAQLKPRVGLFFSE